ncbi:nuclease-related domain-containing protein [Gryllotalpicola koreensis]|uniref:NERD domain-containing protein n=1 Tax=Gryllotalpicola koreensis TaxID=993086 RepID=A0ABP7ZTF3_9MICO
MTELRGANTATGAAASLRARPAAASVIAACLNAQAESRPRSVLGRAFGASPLSEASRQPYLDALSELHVADELEKLGSDWVILHDVPVGERGRVIDHLAIGPAGVFALAVQHQQAAAVTVRGDALAINGVARPHLARSRDLATEAAVNLTRATGLNVPVRGLIVFVAPQSVSVRNEPDDVGITSDRGVHKWLADREQTLSPTQVAMIADAAADPATWRGAVSRRAPGFNADAFDALRVEVQRAWLARGFWGTVLIAAAAVAAFRVFGA